MGPLSPFPIAAISAAYVLMVIRGPKFMATRAPVEPRGLMVAYNAALVALNAYICIEARPRSPIICPP